MTDRWFSEARLKRYGLRSVAILFLLFSGAAFWYSTLTPPVLRAVLAFAFPLVTGLAFRMRRQRSGWVASFVLPAVFFGWYLTDPPRNDRDWAGEYAVPADAVLSGDVAHVSHIRDFTYRTVDDYTPHYYDADFDLKQLDGVDLVTSYWAGENIAHVFLSFAFRSGQHLAVSIETRRQKAFPYSVLAGFFHHYELFYVTADERDLIGVRTDIRRERVYLYRLNLSPETARHLFVNYLTEIHSLTTRPEWYNTLTDNCTTGILARAGARIRYRLDWRVLLSGHTAALAWKLGLLDTHVSFAELKKHSRIIRPPEAQPDADYSAEIRAALRAAAHRDGWSGELP